MVRFVLFGLFRFFFQIVETICEKFFSLLRKIQPPLSYGVKIALHDDKIVTDKILQPKILRPEISAFGFTIGDHFGLRLWRNIKPEDPRHPNDRQGQYRG